MANCGILVVSLDFELLWGVLDHETIDSFGDRILGAKEAIPKLLELFEKYDIHATWGTVGMLFADNKDEILAYAPTNKPLYENSKLSPYKYLENAPFKDNYHFAGELIDLILKQKNQEIGSHTFSHYYCKEKGQNKVNFAADLSAAQKIANDKKGIKLSSLILPRNQFNDEYIECMVENGFKAVRGNPKHYAYNSSSLLARAIRLIDSYINICGKKCYNIEQVKNNGIANIAASRFFRQYSKKLAIFETIKLRCIKSQMKYAAKKGKIFHFWWHPHNVGKNTDHNIKQIETILKYYKELNKKYNFESKNMMEIVEAIEP